MRLFEFLDPLAHALASSGSFLAPNSTNTTARIKMISMGRARRLIANELSYLVKKAEPAYFLNVRGQLPVNGLGGG